MKIPASRAFDRRVAALAALLCVALGWAASTSVTAGISTPDRRSESERAFLRMSEVLTHPRCLNCHTSADFPRQGDDRHRHLFLVARGPHDQGAPGMMCSTCHQMVNNAASGVPGASGWRLAPLRMAWENKSPGQLCKTLLDPEKNGGRSVAQLIQHMRDEPLVQWAWSPGGARSVPPLDQHEFLETVRLWAKTGAACPK